MTYLIFNHGYTAWYRHTKESASKFARKVASYSRCPIYVLAIDKDFQVHIEEIWSATDAVHA